MGYRDSPGQRVYLLTGRPGTGKTSLIKEVVSAVEGRAGGFYTEEIRGQGIRLGFRIKALDGEEAVLAHVDFNKRYRVGKYGVDIDSLDRVGVAALRRMAQDDLMVVDEIGKMELFSAEFREAVLNLITSGRKVLGTIMLDAHPWADNIKRQPYVRLIELTRANYPQVLNEVRDWLKAVL